FRALRHAPGGRARRRTTEDFGHRVRLAHRDAARGHHRACETGVAMMSIRVIVADDHPIARSAIAGLLSLADDIDVVAEASNGREAVALAQELKPDLVLMDLRMPVANGPECDGAAATARIIETVPATRVLILTTYETDDHILGAIEARA